MRDHYFETWLKKHLVRGVNTGGFHGYGWSHIGGCLGAYVLGRLHPEVLKEEPKGPMYVGTMVHEFFQKYVFPDGLQAWNLLIIAHEQEQFINMSDINPVDDLPYQISPIDTLVWDFENKCFGVIDYKSIKDLSWVQIDAKMSNREQVNLYAYLKNAGWYMLIYVDKQNYDNFVIHRYNVDEEMAEKAIEKIRLGNRWLYDEQFREQIPWTDIAGGLTKFSNGNNPYRYICEPSIRTPSYQGCPFKDFCLERLSNQCGTEFKSFTKYDYYLQKHKCD